MKLLYVSDHRFIIDSNGEIYTTGQMNEVYFSRFFDEFDSITVFGLCELKCKKNEKKMVERINTDSDKLSFELVKTSGGLIDRIKSISQIKKQTRDSINNYDRIVTKAPSLIADYVVKSSKTRKNVLVEVVGCPWDSLWNHSIKGKLCAPIMWYTTRRAIMNAPYVLYVTEKFLQKRYPTKGIYTGCSDVMLPSSDISVYEERLKKIERSNHKSRIIGTIGAIDIKYKGHKDVIKAISLLNSKDLYYEYHIVGGGDNDYLYNIARKYNVVNQIKFIGSLPHDKIFDYLDQIDIYIQPSKTEGMPRALIEAMSRGCPSLGTNVGGIPELLDSQFIYSKSVVVELVKLLLRMDNEKMIDAAKRNFNKAKDFDAVILKNKRKEFYKIFAGRQ